MQSLRRICYWPRGPPRQELRGPRRHQGRGGESATITQVACQQTPETGHHIGDPVPWHALSNEQRTAFGTYESCASPSATSESGAQHSDTKRPAPSRGDGSSFTSPAYEQLLSRVRAREQAKRRRIDPTHADVPTDAHGHDGAHHHDASIIRNTTTRNSTSTPRPSGTATFGNVTSPNDTVDPTVEPHGGRVTSPTTGKFHHHRDHASSSDGTMAAAQFERLRQRVIAKQRARLNQNNHGSDTAGDRLKDGDDGDANDDQCVRNGASASTDHAERITPAPTAPSATR